MPRSQMAVIIGDVAVGALLGLGAAQGMRHGGAESLSRETFRRNWLVLRVDHSVLRIVRAHQDCA
jgi:hypothetical protein